ncbi:MAG: hypothetical protein ACRC2R_22080 [Xenococcaceae cyanobacterium]
MNESTQNLTSQEIALITGGSFRQKDRLMKEISKEFINVQAGRRLNIKDNSITIDGVTTPMCDYLNNE